jgi:A/G-specific adenine glycosylase
MKNSTQIHLDLSGSSSPRDSPTDEAIAAFRKQVLSFYERHGRHEMLWRHTDDPYWILVSEIMLQQTQVERVAVKYPEFITAFPDFAALARAPQSTVLAAWQGMGYNRRAIALKKCAEKMVDEFSGIVPRDPKVLATFPGIGPATASSICAFAFNQPVVFIETNIRRVFIHSFFPDKESVTDTEILPLVERALDREQPRVWYWALMDIGTDLKKRMPNPNRKSAAYTKQAPFEGSDRRIRGIILKFLIGKSSVREKAVLDHVREEPVRVRRILAALKKEGFIQKNRAGYRLAD